MKAIFLSIIAGATLAACGGGGGSSGGDNSGNGNSNVTACTYPTALAANPITISGTGGTQTITDTTAKLIINVSGVGKQVDLGACVYVETLTLAGTGHEINTEATSRIKNLNAQVNSTGMRVSVPSASNIVVNDLGNGNNVTQY